ncbi:MAG: hypothetical protein DRG31_06265 [Deltaproteobacteria bacterium]|nr:MAG: hypothetical protein DRG31_06265 [Deltaproteobacteria bacterium]
MYASEKPVITITNPYTQKIEPKQRYDKWVAEIQQQKPSDYTITIQTGEQEKTVAIEGLLSQQEYQAMAGIQDTIDQMYHQLVRDQRLGQGIQQKKNTMKKAAQYASKQTPQNTQAIQATLALGHATTNKKLPENPDDIYNLVKKNQNPLLWNGAETHEYHDDYGNTFKIYTHNQAEHAWLLSRVLAKIEQKHGPNIAQKYGLLIGHDTSWWSQIQQKARDIRDKLDRGERPQIGENAVRIGYITSKDPVDITHPDYLNLALTSTDWYVTLTEQGKTFFPVDDNTLKQKFSDPKDRALALQLLAETPFKTWTTDYTGIEYGFQAAKTFWNHHVPKARQLTEEALKDWPIGPNERHMLTSFYVILGDAAHHGELHSIAFLWGMGDIDTIEHFDENPIAKLIISNVRNPDMDEIYMREYPDAPTNILSRNSEEWRGVKFIYGATHVSPMYADKVGWPKRRPNEREYYEEMLPAMAAANGLPWTWQGVQGLFRAELATTIDDRTASLLRQKYGSDAIIGPANTVGPFFSRKGITMDTRIAQEKGRAPDGRALPERFYAFITWPRHTHRELPEAIGPYNKKIHTHQYVTARL